jgi:hypothetical protein
MGELGTCHLSTQELTITPPGALQQVTKPFKSKCMSTEGAAVLVYCNDRSAFLWVLRYYCLFSWIVRKLPITVAARPKA